MVSGTINTPRTWLPRSGMSHRIQPFGLDRWKNVDTQNDPTGKCLPVGPSRAFTAPMPFQIVQSPTMIAFLFEYQTIYRMVYMDGRPHPPEIMDYPEFMGHSIGHWEGGSAGYRHGWHQ